MEPTQIETNWGTAAIQKKAAHYSRLRVGQLKSRIKRHLKRIKDMDFIQKRLYELGLANGGWYWAAVSLDPAFKARYNYEQKLYWAAQDALRQREKQTPQQQKDAQKGYQNPSGILRITA